MSSSVPSPTSTPESQSNPVGVVIGCLLILALIGGGFYLLYLFQGAVLFYAYVSIGALIALFGLVMGLRARFVEASSTAQSRFKLLLLRAVVHSQAQGFWGKLGAWVTWVKNLIEGAAKFVRNSVLWMASMYFGLHVQRMINALPAGAKPTSNWELFQKQALFSRIRARREELAFSITALLLIVICYLLNLAFGGGVAYSMPFVELLLVGMFAKHLLYVAGNQTLPARLRQSTGNVVTGFAALAVLDFLTLTLTLNAVLNWRPDVPILEAGNLLQVSKQLLAGSYRKVFEGQLSPEVMLTVVASLLFDAGFVLRSVLFNYKDFFRSDADKLEIARHAALFGNYDEAREWLHQIGSRTAPYYELSGVLHLAKGEIDEAIQDCRLYRSIEAGRDATDAEAVHVLGGGMLFFAIPAQSQRALMIRARELLGDAELCQFILIASQMGFLTDDDLEPFPPTPTGEPVNPLCSALIRLMHTDRGGTREILRAFHPASELDFIVAHNLLMTVFIGTVGTEEAHLIEDVEPASVLDGVIRSVEELAGSPEAGPFEKMIGYIHASEMVEVAQRLGLGDAAGSLAGALSELGSALEKDPATAQMLKIRHSVSAVK